MTVFTKEEMAEGLKRLGKSPDAQMFLRKYLVKVLMSIPPADATSGAVRINLGRRTLASDLLNAMEFASDGRTDDDADAARRGSGPSGPALARSRSRVPDISPDDAAAAELRKRGG